MQTRTRRWPAACTALLLGLLLVSPGAHANELRFTFDVPLGYVVMPSANEHSLISPDALTTVQIRSFPASTATDIERLLAQLPSMASDDELVAEGTARKRSATTWTLRFSGGPEEHPLVALVLLRLFPGEGAVMVRGVSDGAVKPAALDAIVSRIGKSLRSGTGAPGGEAVHAARAPKRSDARVGPWQLSWTKHWARQQGHEGQVRLQREAPQLFVVAQYAPGLDADAVAALARRPFPLGDAELPPVGEPHIAAGRVTNMWRSEALVLISHTRCAEDGCLFLSAGGAREHAGLLQNALYWFVANTKRQAPALAEAPALDDVDVAAGERQATPARQKRRAPSKKNKLVRKVAGKRLSYSVTTGYGSDGLFVGGRSAREYHFCSDGSVYSAEDDELVATGYERIGAGSRQGVWSTTTFMDRDALFVVWSDGSEETLVNADPLAHLEPVLEQARGEERRKIEAVLRASGVSNKVMLQRLGEGAPWVFEREPSSLCGE